MLGKLLFIKLILQGLSKVDAINQTTISWSIFDQGRSIPGGLLEGCAPRSAPTSESSSPLSSSPASLLLQRVREATEEGIGERTQDRGEVVEEEGEERRVQGQWEEIKGEEEEVEGQEVEAKKVELQDQVEEASKANFAH